MRFIGDCPHCGEPLEFTAAPAPVGTCESCAGRYSIAVPELEGQGHEDVELLVLPIRTASPLDALLEKRRLKRPIFYALIAGAVGIAGLVLTGVLAVVAPEAARPLFITLFLLLVLGATVGSLSFLMVWSPFWRGTQSPKFDPLRSLLALAGGSTLLLGLQAAAPLVLALLLALVGAYLLAFSGGKARGIEVWRLLLAAVTGAAIFVLAFYVPAKAVSWLIPAPSSRAFFLGYSILISVIVGSAAGWLTGRVAPSAPYRHAVGAVLVVALGEALLASVFAQSLRYVASTLLYGLIYVPLLLFGAWLSVRRASNGTRAQAAS